MTKKKKSNFKTWLAMLCDWEWQTAEQTKRWNISTMVDYRCMHSTPYVPVFRCLSECYDIYMRMGGLTTERTETDDEAKLKINNRA